MDGKLRHNFTCLRITDRIVFNHPYTTDAKLGFRVRRMGRTARSFMRYFIILCANNAERRGNKISAYNAIHKAIWDSFCNNRRPDRVPLQFKVLGVDHEYPKCRSKRTSYEWYIPKGIVKTSWMKKHLELIPSVVVVFFDLDWDEVMWKERQMECATKVEIVRNSLTGRSTRVCVVLIQKNAPLPPGEDVIAAERAASLCSACELSAKSLFVLPLTDHLLGYTIRLENAFYELAQGYYHTEARRVKAHKEFLNKTTHQLLFVRHQFKIAFCNEMKQDTHTALKHYKQAYTHILELRMHDTNLLEVKTIAGFISYKICRLSFQHNAPLDAIAQFRKHIDYFKTRVGSHDLAFEHSAWMSKQFQVFGDLFDEAIKLGLTAIQTQHPGFYYQQAANHAVARKHLCTQLCSSAINPPSPDPLESLDHLDYYGQRPWRQGHQSIDPPDALKERDGIQALHSLELKVDHSWIIIPLLSSSVAQFKKYKSPRMKRYLMVQMGEEYYHAEDYAKALTLLSRVTWDYRQERWWPLLTSILSTALRCSYLVANVQEYVTICLEMSGKYIECSAEEKTRIQMNLIRVMSSDPPEPEPGCNQQAVEKARHQWKAELASQEPNIFTIEMASIIPFVECKACFVADSFTADSAIVLKVYLRTSCPFPIRFSKLSVLLSNQVYNQHCLVVDGKGLTTSSGEEESGDLYLVPGLVKSHTFTFYAQPEDVSKSLEISSVAVELGCESKRCAILHWVGGGGDANGLPIGSQANLKTNKHTELTSDTPWDMIFINSLTKILPRTPCMDLSVIHEPPALVNEFYKIQLDITNNETVTISDIRLSVGLKEGQHVSLEQYTHMSMDTAVYDGKPVSRISDISLGSMEPGGSTNKTLYIKSLQIGDRMVFVKINYELDVVVNDQTIKCTCHKEQSVVLPTMDPFKVTVGMKSLQYEVLETVHAEEPFLLITDLECSCPWPVLIETTKIGLSSYIKFDDENHIPQLDGETLNSGDCASECTCLVALPSIQPTISMGTYRIYWKRKSSDESVPAAVTTISLPNTTIEHIPLYVDLDMPAHANVRKPYPVTYNVYNRTPYSQEVELNMETSEAFMFAGHKMVHFRILPNSKREVKYNFVPLLSGNVPLPKLQLNMLRYPGTMDKIIAKMLPTHVFVLPSGRNPECLVDVSDMTTGSSAI